MILKLDKGDTKEILREFVDIATRKEINDKFCKAFDERMETIICTKANNTDFDKLIKNTTQDMLNKHFNPERNGHIKSIDTQVKQKLDEIDFKKMLDSFITDELVDKIADKIADRIKGGVRIIRK